MKLRDSLIKVSTNMENIENKTEVNEMAQTNTSSVTANAVQTGAEYLLPGGSQLLNGKLISGGLHLVAAVAAGTVLGPLGVLLVAGNSLSNSLSEKHLHQHAMNAASKLN